MAAPSALWNGERVVVLLFISRVVLSAPAALYLEAAALVLLALGAFLVEVAADSQNSLARFKTRPGASSGILLGAVVLPAVMLSRLIQMMRAFLAHEIGSEDIDYMSIQYWAVSVSSIWVLIFLHGSMLYSVNDKNISHSKSLKYSKFSIFLLACYATSCLISLSASYSGESTAVKLLWTLFHGLASVKLIQHILQTFPSCASIGEALLVTSGLVSYFVDMLGLTLTKFSSIQMGSRRGEISIIIQGILLGLLLLPFFYKLLVLTENYLTKRVNFRSLKTEGCMLEVIGRSIVFFASLAIIVVLVVPAWMQFVHDFSVHPIMWVLSFVFSGSSARIMLCVYWMLIICLSVVYFYNISKRNKVERILLRKNYHLVAVLMFVPALVYQPDFLDLSFGVALAGFLVVETIRVWRIWPLGNIVHQFMNAFTDHRDSEILIVSHFSLLLGCAIPKWMSAGHNDRPLAPFAGILSLGIGDTMASVVGHKYGVLRWSKTGKKTIEGTAAGIMSVLVACSILIPFLASTGFILSQHWISLLVAVTLTGLLEAYTVQLDNAFIPLVFYSLLTL